MEAKTINPESLQNQLLNIMLSLSGQRDIPRLYKQIIVAAQQLTRADGGTLYVVGEHKGQQVLRFEVVRNTSLGISMGAGTSHPINFEPVPLYTESGSANNSNVCAHAYHNKQATNIADVYETHTFDFSGTKVFDQQTGYRSQSMLTVPLIDHEGTVIGVLQLLNAQSPQGQTIAFAPQLENIVAALSSSAAITLNNQILLQGHKDLLDAFIKSIAEAIDSKSSHTSAHCQRVPVLTKMLAQAACDTQEGPLAGFHLDDDGWYELHVAAWLHDCGKLSTPDILLDKATKLHALHDRIETIEARFAALIAQTKLRALSASSEAETKRLNNKCKLLQEELEFLKVSNIGGEFMRPEDQARIREIATRTWVNAQGVEQSLLTPDETSMLCIPRGTISNEERERINDHIVVTIKMLEALPFPKTLQRVPEYAGGHHERVDGKGYPKGLTGQEMSWPARMMAIADVFEALTAQDRPYKPPMPLSQALSILKRMAETGHIDPDLFQLFIKHKVWLQYANKFMLPAQRDVQDASGYLL